MLTNSTNQDLRVGDRYRLQRRIGGGSCGAVYIGNTPRCSQILYKTNYLQATDIDNGNEVAIKLEHRSIEPSFLSNEACIYESLSGGPGILRVHDYYGQECDYSAMVFDLLGPSLEDLYKFCGRKFTLKTVLLLADQLIARLQYIHSKGFIHQDIKPSNLLLGTGKAGNLVYITDLGLACERSTAKEVARYYHTDRPRLIGTQLFASYRGHLGVGKRDIPGSCCPKTNWLSTTSSRRSGISRIHTSLLYPGSPVAKIGGREQRLIGRTRLGEEENDQCSGTLWRSSPGVHCLLQSYPFSCLRREPELCLLAQEFSKPLRAPGLWVWSRIWLDNSQISDGYPTAAGAASSFVSWVKGWTIRS